MPTAKAQKAAETRGNDYYDDTSVRTAQKNNSSDSRDKKIANAGDKPWAKGLASYGRVGDWFDRQNTTIGNAIDKAFDNTIGELVYNASGQTIDPRKWLTGENVGTGVDLAADIGMLALAPYTAGATLAPLLFKVTGQNADSMAEAIGGRDLETGEELSDSQRYLKGGLAGLNTALMMLPAGGVFRGAKAGAKGLRELAGKYGKEASEATGVKAALENIKAETKALTDSEAVARAESEANKRAFADIDPVTGTLNVKRVNSQEAIKRAEQKALKDFGVESVNDLQKESLDTFTKQVRKYLRNGDEDVWVAEGYKSTSPAAAFKGEYRAGDNGAWSGKFTPQELQAQEAAAAEDLRNSIRGYVEAERPKAEQAWEKSRTKAVDDFLGENEEIVKLQTEASAAQTRLDQLKEMSGATREEINIWNRKNRAMEDWKKGGRKGKRPEDPGEKPLTEEERIRELNKQARILARKNEEIARRRPHEMELREAYNNSRYYRPAEDNLGEVEVPQNLVDLRAIESDLEEDAGIARIDELINRVDDETLRNYLLELREQKYGEVTRKIAEDARGFAREAAEIRRRNPNISENDLYHQMALNRARSAEDKRLSGVLDSQLEESVGRTAELNKTLAEARENDALAQKIQRRLEYEAKKYVGSMRAGGVGTKYLSRFRENGWRGLIPGRSDKLLAGKTPVEMANEIGRKFANDEPLDVVEHEFLAGIGTMGPRMAEDPVADELVKIIQRGGNIEKAELETLESEFETLTNKAQSALGTVTSKGGRIAKAREKRASNKDNSPLDKLERKTGVRGAVGGIIPDALTAAGYGYANYAAENGPENAAQMVAENPGLFLQMALAGALGGRQIMRRLPTMRGYSQTTPFRIGARGSNVPYRSLLAAATGTNLQGQQRIDADGQLNADMSQALDYIMGGGMPLYDRDYYA